MSSIKRGVAIAVTGGIACGKSEVAQVLAECGAAVCDADRLTHETLNDPAIRQTIVARFGEEMLDSSGMIDRPRLGQKVFSNENERKELEGIIHPRVIGALQAWLSERLKHGETAAAVVPLLFEVGLTKGWDAIICVSSPERLVVERLKRRGLSEEEAQRRIAAQLPVEEKAAKSDYVIRNEGTLESLRERTTEVFKDILREERISHGRTEGKQA